MVSSEVFFKVPFRGGVVIIITPLPLGLVDKLVDPVSMS